MKKLLLPIPGIVFFVLQETPGLAPTNWTAATNASVTAGNQNQVTVTPKGTAQFFRLFQSQ
jgi:hypothetical protein